MIIDPQRRGPMLSSVYGGDPVGVSLANVVLSVTWAHLSDAAQLVFARMAMTALDGPSPDGRPAARYFGGRDALVLATDKRGLSDDPEIRELQYKKVQRAIQEITAAGGLKLLKLGNRGCNSEYEIYVLPGERKGVIQ